MEKERGVVWKKGEKKSKFPGVRNPGFTNLGKSNKLSQSWLFYVKMELVKKTYSVYNENTLTVSDNAMHTVSAK